MALDDIDHYIDIRIMGWAGHMARMPITRLPRKLLTSYIAKPRRLGAPPKTYGRTLRTCFKRKKVACDGWLLTASNRELWREAAKTKRQSKKNMRLNPQSLIGRLVEKKFNMTWHVGVVTDFDMDDVTRSTIWRISYDDGDSADYDMTELKRILLDTGQLGEAMTSLKSPQRLIGRVFQKSFRNITHHGIIINHDEDKQTGDVIWRVNFQDGDHGDYDYQEIARGLLPRQQDGDGDDDGNTTNSLD